MCLTTLHSEPKVTETDITVYKVLCWFDNEWVSPFRHEPYQVGELKTVEKFGMRQWVGTTEINEGLHSCLNVDATKLSQGLCSPFSAVFKCTIPAGTPYFVGWGDDVVSLALRVEEKCV